MGAGKRRSGGRSARRAARVAGPGNSAVRPGHTGGRYKPLSDSDIKRIHDAALDVLENIGIGDPIPEILDYALPGGCTLGEDNRLRFPRALVEDLIAQSAKEYPLYAPDPKNDLMVRGQEVLFTTSGEAVTILDYDSQKFRPTRLTDLYDAARLGGTTLILRMRNLQVRTNHSPWASPSSNTLTYWFPCLMPTWVRKAAS